MKRISLHRFQPSSGYLRGYDFHEKMEKKNLLGILKAIYNDLHNRNGVNLYVEHLIRNLPRHFGMHIREKWYGRRFKRCGGNLHVLPGAYIINPHLVECGDNFFIGINNYIQAGGGIVCGNNVMMGPYAMIWTQNHIFADYRKPIWKQGYEYKPVKIGNDVWIGANVFIMPGANIGNGCVISANSVVGAKSYPDGSIIAGNPARKIGERDIPRISQEKE